MSEHEQETLLHDILYKVSSFDGRLIVLEERSYQAQHLKRWILGLVGLVLLQLGGFGYAWGQFTNRLDNIDVSALEQTLGTSLTVLADHGTELAQLRGELAHLRGQLDSRTADRFTGAMGLAHENRLERLENKLFFKGYTGDD